MVEGTELIDDDLHPTAGRDRVVRAKSVKHAKALDRAIVHGHAGRQPLDIVAAPDGHDLDAQGLGRRRFGERQPAERVDRFTEGPVDLQGLAPGREDEAKNLLAGTHDIETEPPILALGRCGGCGEAGDRHLRH